MESFKKEFEKAEKDVSERIKTFIKKDTKLGLYSLAPSKNKDNICFPEVFTGKLGELKVNFGLKGSHPGGWVSGLEQKMKTITFQAKITMTMIW